MKRTKENLVRYLEVLKHLERLNKDQQTYEKEFYSNKISEQIEPVYLVVKLKEAKLD